MKHRTVIEWSKATGFSYRVLLDAVRQRELTAYRPGGDHGPIMVSEDDFMAWRQRIKLRATISQPAPLPRHKRSRRRFDPRPSAQV